MPQRPLPSTIFCTDQAAGEERFDAWRSSISVIFDASPVAGADLRNFHANVNGFHLGSLLVADHFFGAQQFSRTLPRMARDGLDHYLIQWYRTGGFIGRHGNGQEMRLEAGNISVLELNQPIHTIAQNSEVLSVLVPRTLMDEALGDERQASLHGAILSTRTALGGMLADHLQSVHARLPGIAAADAPAVAHATTQMLAACLRPSLRTLAQAQAELRNAVLARMQRHIDQHLGSQLSPDALMREFGLSRSQLYRLFEPQGGVAHYVLQRRLQRAFQTLTSPAHLRLKVADIATRLGFTSEAHFSRAFRASFGMTPSDARAMGSSSRNTLSHASLLASSAEYAHWVRDLQAPMALH